MSQTHLQTDRIERQVHLKATLARVWRALTDVAEFSTWFCVDLTAPFVVGQTVSGRLTYPGYENIVLDLVVERMDRERLFAFRWHPYAVDPAADYSTEPMTLVEFHLDAVDGGTRLTVSESGFDRLPPARRDLAFRMNDGGWEEQLENIQRHVDG